MLSASPVLFLYDEFCHVVWISRTEPPFTPEDVIGKVAWHVLDAPGQLALQAASARVLSDGTPQVVDIDIPKIGRWRCWLFPARVGKVRVAGYAQRFPDAILILTDREREVAALFSDGLSGKEVAARLQISRSTVDNHRSAIARKAGIYSGAIPAWCGSNRQWL